MNSSTFISTLTHRLTLCRTDILQLKHLTRWTLAGSPSRGHYVSTYYALRPTLGSLMLSWKLACSVLVFTWLWTFCLENSEMGYVKLLKPWEYWIEQSETMFAAATSPSCVSWAESGYPPHPFWTCIYQLDLWRGTFFWGPGTYR